MKPKAISDDLGELSPLPDRLPATVEARVGEVEFRGGLPTGNGIDRLFDIQDFQRACQLYQWAIPAIGVACWQKANLAQGTSAQTDWVLVDDPGPRSGILTADAQGAYVVATPDLQKTGPLILEYPAGKITGYVMDCWQRPLIDFGQTGPEKGVRGGRLVLLGPGQVLNHETQGLRVARSSTRLIVIVYRIMNSQEVDRYTPHMRLYQFAERATPPDARVVRARKPLLLSHPRGLACWSWIHELIQREDGDERDRLFLGMLRAIGIEKGRPFEPAERLRQILEDAAALGEQLVRASLHHNRAASSYYRDDARWRLANNIDPEHRQEDYDQFDERSRFFYETFGAPASAGGPGAGTVCLAAYSDSDANWLDGGQSYRVRIAANPPVRHFWVLTAYDLDTRTLFPGSANAEIHSGSQGLQTNNDGSVDVYFGPAAPEGCEHNWIHTPPGRFWYAYLRLAGPTDGFFDRSWLLPDIENVTNPLRGWWASISRPSRVLRTPGRNRNLPRPR